MTIEAFIVGTGEARASSDLTDAARVFIAVRDEAGSPSNDLVRSPELAKARASQ